MDVAAAKVECVLSRPMFQVEPSSVLASQLLSYEVGQLRRLTSKVLDGAKPQFWKTISDLRR